MWTLCQTGVQYYESFNKLLESLASWTVEAEDVLKVQDPIGCNNMTVIQERLEELKVLSYSSPHLFKLSSLKT